MAVDPTYNTKNYEKQGGDEWDVGGTLDILTGGALKIAGVDMTAAIAALPPSTNYAVGTTAGVKIAAGVHLQVAQSDTVATGMTTVVGVCVTFRDAPTAKQQYVYASIGDQAGAPVAGSFLLNTLKSTLAVADDLTDNIHFNWVAVGT